MAGFVRTIEARGHDVIRRREAASVPDDLRRRWRDPSAVGSASAAAVWRDRLHRDRTEIVPWLASFQPMDGARILEIGGGRGASTFALAEQGAQVTVLDINQGALRAAAEVVRGEAFAVDFVLGNAAAPPFVVGSEPFDLVIFWASFEHMTLAERRDARDAAWRSLAPGGALVVIEAPNRLWPFDSHTSDLPFFNWLPDDLATRFRSTDLREAVRSVDPGDDEHLARLGRGVSFHDFADADGHLPEVVSCMQLRRRAEDRLRSIGWAASRAGRTERLLHSYAPSVDRAWFQPFLYLALRRGSAG